MTPSYLDELYLHEFRHSTSVNNKSLFILLNGAFDLNWMPSGLESTYR